MPEGPQSKIQPKRTYSLIWAFHRWGFVLLLQPCSSTDPQTDQPKPVSPLVPFSEHSLSTHILEIKFSQRWQQIWGHFGYSTIKKDLLKYSSRKSVGKSSLSATEKLWLNLSCRNCELTISCEGAFIKTSSKMDEWTWPRRDAELPGTVCKVQRLKEIQQKRLKLPSNGGMLVHLCAALCRRSLVSSPSLQGSCIVSNTITIKSFVTCNKIKQIPFPQNSAPIYTRLFTGNKLKSIFCPTFDSSLSHASWGPLPWWWWGWWFRAFTVYPAENIEPVTMAVSSGTALKTNPGPKYDLKAASLARAFEIVMSVFSLASSGARVLLEMRFVSETIWFNLHSRNSVFTSWVRENISALWYFYIKYSIKVRGAFVLQPLVTRGQARPLCCVYHCRNPTERLCRSTWWSWPAVDKDGGGPFTQVQFKKTDLHSVTLSPQSI